MSNKANVKVHFEQGGAEEVVESGGKITVRSGGVINFETGGQMQINGSDVTSSVSGAAVAGVAAGYKIARGEATLDGSNPTPVTTGLATVVAAIAVLKTAVAPGVGTTTITVDYGGGVTAGELDIHAWKPTSSSNPTLIASTDSSSVVSWIAIGT